MNRFLHAIVIILLFPSLVYAAGIEYQLGVDGVACPFCVYGIEKQLSKLDGIKRIDTDIKKSLIYVLMEENSTLNEISIRQAVNKAGFSLRSFEQTEMSQ